MAGCYVNDNKLSDFDYVLVWISRFPCSCQLSRYSLSSFDHPVNICWRVQIVKLLIKKFSPPSYFCLTSRQWVIFTQCHMDFYAIGGRFHFMHYNFIVSKIFIDESARWKQQHRPKCCMTMGRPSRDMQHLLVFKSVKHQVQQKENFCLILPVISNGSPWPKCKI